MIEELSELQRHMMKFAAWRGREPVDYKLLSDNRWRFRVGDHVIDGGAEVDDAFSGLIERRLLEVKGNSYVLTPDGRHLAANLLQSER